ncbi:MAG: helix-turn-helix transcriptional regulator [Cardiobacteriaceae bacterium]|nr:helix-turn-helix transcriptional regulator [Cardiobacteriaceae bacterium]
MTDDPQALLDAIGAHIRAELAAQRDITPAGIAAHFGVNRYTLSRWFRRHAHMRLADYLAALKIEQGIAPLIARQSVIDAQQQSGHQSAATFAHRFRHATGITPRDYRAQSDAYRQLLDAELAHDSGRIIPYRRVPVGDGHPLHVHIHGSNARLVFAGLFPEPVPRGVPLAGAALFARKRFTIAALPPGSYWLLGCELLASRNPLDYFRLDHCQRERYPDPITFPLAAPQMAELVLRPFLPGDPPITVNLPRLLFEVLRGGRS